MHYPRQFEIVPLTKPPRAKIRVPGSKSITNRALVLAALTQASHRHVVVLEGVLESEDTAVMSAALWQLGYLQVRSAAIDHADLFVANSGTTMRFLTAVAALGNGRFRIDGVKRMRERPIADLLDALTQLGVDARSENDDGCPPVIVAAHGIKGGTASIKGNTSSQFLSGLLMAAPFARADVTLEIDGTLVSAPYVTMTLAMVRQFGLRVEQPTPTSFYVPAPQRPTPLERYAIEPDASAASYFFGAAAISGGSITVADLSINSLQGDIRFVDVLEQVGCRVERDGNGITVHGGPLHGIDVDMNDISDTVMTLAAVACFAEGPTTIRNVAHIRHKETDRLAALATELRRLGAGVEERADGLAITPAPLHGAVVQTYNDHRMAMSLALIGLKIPGIVIDNPACIAKTYPQYFDDLERLR